MAKGTRKGATNNKGGSHARTVSRGGFGAAGKSDKIQALLDKLVADDEEKQEKKRAKTISKRVLKMLAKDGATSVAATKKKAKGKKKKASTSSSSDLSDSDSDSSDDDGALAAKLKQYKDKNKKLKSQVEESEVLRTKLTELENSTQAHFAAAASREVAGGSPPSLTFEQWQEMTRKATETSRIKSPKKKGIFDDLHSSSVSTMSREQSQDSIVEALRTKLTLAESTGDSLSEGVTVGQDAEAKCKAVAKDVAERYFSITNNCPKLAALHQEFKIPGGKPSRGHTLLTSLLRALIFKSISITRKDLLLD